MNNITCEQHKYYGNSENAIFKTELKVPICYTLQ